MYEEILNLEKNMFDSLEAAYKYINLKQPSKAKPYIATIEVLNEEYKELTQQDFVRPSIILDLYERLWSSHD